MMIKIQKSENLKHSFLYDSEALMPASLVATPIFSPVERKMAKTKELSEFEISRTKHERIIFNGLKLDLKRDYSLFHLIMRKKQVTGKKSFEITEKEITKSLGIQNRASNKKDIDTRIKKMMTCFFEIEKFNDDGETIHKIYSNLINRVKWDVVDKIFHIEISDDLYNAEQLVDYEILNLDVFSSIKSQYSRALFLFYETFKFINQGSVNLPMEKLGIRLGKNNMEQKYINQEIKKANNELIERGYLKDAEYFKAQNGSSMCKIFR
jgi:hypothetical protein